MDAIIQDHIQAGVIQQTKIEAKTTGKPVSIGNSPHVRTNHYIRESRPYIRNRELNEYRSLGDANIMVIFAIWLVVSVIITFLYWILPTVYINLFINIRWVSTFIQHMTVVYDTIPYILKQPIVPNNQLQLTNDFVEIDIHQVQGAYAISQDGFGILQSSQGKIKFHVLSERAASTIRMSRTYSIIGFLCSLVMVIVSIVMVPFSIITYIINL